MTEPEWLSCDNPTPMLEFLRGRASERRLRLFAVACCRRIWHRLIHDGSRAAVSFAEQYADGLCGPDEIGTAWAGANDARDLAFSAQEVHRRSRSALEYYAASAAYDLMNVPPPEDDPLSVVLEDAGNSCEWAASAQVHVKAERAIQASLLRDVIGNPFRPVTVAPEWQTPSIVELARQIYEDRSFDRLAEMAESLEAAGCTDAEILRHCRSVGAHVRGCWVLDQLLGKA